MSRRNKDYDDLDEIEKAAGNLLEELNQLEQLPDSLLTKDNYMSFVQEIQNKMRDAILQGIQLNDREKFLDGLKYYEKNYEILTSIGDKKVCEDYQHEMIQILTDIIVHFKKEINNPLRRYFIIISLQFIAKIYEDAEDFAHAIEIHLTISKLLNSWANALEYALIFLDYLFINDTDKATDQLAQFDSLESNIYLLNMEIIEQSLQSHRVIKLKEFCENILTGVTKDLPIFIQDAEELLKALDISNNFAFDHLSALLTLYKKKFEKQREVKPLTPIEATQRPLSSETQLLTRIKDVILESLGSHPPSPKSEAQGVKMDTSSLLTELKKFISDSIKSMSQEIITNVSKFTIMASPTSSSLTNRNSHNIDNNVPEIKIANPTDTDEKPKRPKLSDVIGSIIVSE